MLKSAMPRLMRAIASLGFELQRAAESIGGFFVFELFEQRDADVVRAIRVFASVRFRCSFCR